MSEKPQTAIVGIGATEQGEIPGQSANDLIVRAAIIALIDAGIQKSDIDGLVTCKSPRSGPDAGTDEAVGAMLGINPAFSSTLEYGAAGFSLHLAAMAITAGLANCVLLTFGSNQRSSRVVYSHSVGGAKDWASLVGLAHVAGPAAMAARRHMHLYGTTEEQLGWVSVAQREWASMNPRAIFREPLTIDDYLAMPYVVAPLRRPDLTMISDGAVAVVLTRADRVSQHPEKPVYLLGMSQQSALRTTENADNLMRPWIKTIGDRLWNKTGARPSDIDVAYLQDATSVWVLQMLEWYGFVGLGDAGSFLAEGNTRPGGSLPVNTNGGQLSESYMWNWLQLHEAVVQLRGKAGDRQVRGARVALHAQTHDFWKGAATLLASSEEL